MKDILSAIKTTLQDGLTAIRDGDVFITPALNFLPSGVRSNLAVGIKDGPVARRDLSCAVVEKTMQVQIAAFVRLQKPEAAIMGDESTSSPGVLDAIDDIEQLLTDNLLGVAGLISARPGPESPSELLVADESKAVWQTKTITYTYVWEG